MYIAGYILKSLYDSKHCFSCCAVLEACNPVEEIYSLTKNQGTYWERVLSHEDKQSLPSTDRGGLKYPSIPFLARLWTIKRFVESVLPRLKGCSNIVKAFVQLCTTHLVRCPELACSRSLELPGLSDIGHRTKVWRVVVRKLVSPIVGNQCRVWTEQMQPAPIVHRKPLKRKVLKLQ